MFSATPDLFSLVEDSKDEDMALELSALSTENFRNFLHYTPTPPPLRLPTEQTLKKCLQDNFQLQEFRPKQLETIRAIMEGNDCFLRMATGSGKSLLWQLPALCQEGKNLITVVILPTVALIMDQMQQLCKIKSPTFLPICHYGGMPRELQDFSCWLLSKPHIGPQCLLLTPNQLNYNTISSLLINLCKSGHLARFIIDEADKVLTWGHSFSESYHSLKDMRRDFPSVQIVAMTGSITVDDMDRCISTLGMQDCVKFSSSLDRPNLNYQVKSKCSSTLIQDVTSLRRNGPGIIYCTKIRETMQIASKLRTEGINAQAFHSQVPSQEKRDIHSSWKRGNIEVIVATKAFGMGIDKHNVRWVVHDTLPASVEDWFQESGRAGRDGKNADCIIYYQAKDYYKVKRLIANPAQGQEDSVSNHSSCQLQEEVQNFESSLKSLKNLIVVLMDTTSCHRQKLLKHFGEQYSKENCGACGICCRQAGANHWSKQNVTVDAQNAVRLLEQMQSLHPHWTDGELAKAICGKDSKKGIKLSTLNGFNCGFPLPNGKKAGLPEVQEFVVLLITQGILTEYRKCTHPTPPIWYTCYIKPSVCVEDIAAMELHMNFAVISEASHIHADNVQGLKVVKEVDPKSGTTLDVIVIDVSIFL